MLEHILDHFEALEKQVKNGDFNDHPGIQNSIIEAWNKTKDYYVKTDASIATRRIRLDLYPPLGRSSKSSGPINTGLKWGA